MFRFLSLMALVLSIYSTNICHGSILDLKVTEIMYNLTKHEGISGEYLEFIDLKNTGTGTINLNGLKVINFTFRNTDLAPGKFVVLVSDSNSFKFATRP
ncbi:MAG: lamin tail domain-containing protein [Flavobacteriales bacterium]|nr:lamin tail domain-containing protein [Flavobacteriales bacterium]